MNLLLVLLFATACASDINDFTCAELKAGYQARSCCGHMVVQGHNPDEIVQNSGMYTDAGAKCYYDGDDISSEVQVSGDVVDASRACGTTFEVR